MEELKRLPTFTFKEFRAVLGLKSNYAKVLIHRLKKAGKVFQIKKGVYTFHKDAFLIASHIAWPSYISLNSALRYYNFTEQVFHAIWVISTRKERRINFDNTQIIFVKAKPKFFFGYKKVLYNNFEIFMAEKEKAIVDCLLFKKVPFHEVYEIVEKNIDELSLKKLVEFSLKTGESYLVKRIGFLLEKIGFDCYHKMKKYISKTYIPLEPSLKKEGRKNEKWFLIENVKL